MECVGFWVADPILFHHIYNSTLIQKLGRWLSTAISLALGILVVLERVYKSDISIILLATGFPLRSHEAVNLRRIQMKKLGILALLLCLSACGSIAGYSLNPMDYLSSSSDTGTEATE